MTKYRITYCNAEANMVEATNYAFDTLTEALALVAIFRKDEEYVYITNEETDETFVTYDGFAFYVVPEV